MDFAATARPFFEERFNIAPAVVVRAPGRVNLIGEHTDYAHLPVLPVAINRALWIAAAPVDEPVVRATSKAFRDDVEVRRDDRAERVSGWVRYVAGVLGQLSDVAPGRGACIAIDGDLPASGGLSSSSALSVGLVAALSAAWGAALDPEDIAQRATVAERAVGVETGGMDQQVISFAQAGSALRLDFSPLARRHVPLSDGMEIVVASSGEDAPKGGRAREAYNERVIGMRLATALLAERVGVDPAFPLRLGNVANIDVVDLLAEELQPAATVQTVARLTRIPIAKIARFTAGPSWDINREVSIRPVAMHILSEAARVDAAEAALLAGDLHRFGKLVDESHASLRDLMQCSTPALDRLCDVMRTAGAYGARLTGAGFGGYALAISPPDKTAEVIAAAQRANGGASAFAVETADGVGVE